MQVSPFVNSGPEILPLDTDFWVPDWWRPTGCRWTFEPTRHTKDKDGQRIVKYNKKFALRGEVGSYKFGTIKRYPKYIRCEAGLVCSRESLLMVAECDTPELWDAGLLGDAVPTVRSSRGYHYYFAVPADLVDLLPTDGELPGGDVQTSGFVPCPGTTHPSGVRYELVADRINVADADLLLRICKVREEHKAAQLGEYKARGGTGDWSGNGGVNGHDDYMSQVVLWRALLDGKTEAEVRDIWLAEAAALPLKDKNYPFSDADFERQYRTAERKKARLVKSGLWNPGAVVDETVLAWAAGAGGDGGDDDEPPYDEFPDAENEGEGGDDEFLPPGYVIPDPYELTTDAAWEVVVKNKQEATEKITHRPVIVTGVQLDEEGGTSYELTWETHRRERKSVVVPAADIADRSRLVRVFPELVVMSKGSGQAAEYLAACRTANAEWLDARTVRIASSLGWYGREGTDEFVLGNGRPYEVKDETNLGSWLTGYTTKGELSEWTQAMSAAPWRVRLLVTAALSAPLLRILGARGFILDNSNVTTRGKTKGARAAASVWGSPSSLLLSWSDTKVALERYASSVHGLPVIVDESKLARDGEQIAAVVYQIAAGVSAARGDRSGGRLQERSTIETCLVTNGEEPLLAASGRKDGGAFARVLEMSGPPFENAEQADALDAVIGSHYGHAGEALVRALHDADHDRLRARYHDLRESARSLGDTDVARRRGDAVAVMMLASEVAFDAGLLPRLPELAWVELMQDTAGEEGSDDLAQMALEMVWRKVALDQRLFWQPEPSIGGVSLTIGRDMPFGGWAGRVDLKEGWAAISPDWLRKFLTENGMDAEGILRQWSERQWIALDSKGRRQVMVRVAGRSIRCVKVIHGAEQASDSEVAEESSSGGR